MGKRILLMYITDVSGHRSASLAVEKGIRSLAPDTQILNINVFSYTNPVWERIINKAYMSVVKTKPEIWDYLYDNPKVLTRIKKIRELIHKTNTDKLRALFDNFKPDAVACTQAYPCGMVADYKKNLNVDLPLVGILTDYAPHSYWIYNNVDVYVVPSEETGQKLVRDGVLKERVRPLGIPIDPKYTTALDKNLIHQELNLDPGLPTILVMGGGQGLGPIQKIILYLDRMQHECQVLVVTGINKKLFNWIKQRNFRKKVMAFGHIDFVDKLMEVATLIITKPGGVTTAEALAKELPMIIIHPLPGQEAVNTRFLLKQGMALKVDNEEEMATVIDWLLGNPVKIGQISENIRRHARPDAAVKIAQLLLDLAS